MEKRFNKKESEMLGKPIEDFAELAFGDRNRPFLISVLLGKDSELIKPYYKNITTTDSGMIAEANTKFSGEDLNYIVSAEKILDAEGKVVGVLEVIKIVDDLVRIQKEVSKARSHLEALIENTEDIITLLDKDLNLIAFNSAYVKWIKDRIGREPMVGDNCTTLLKEDVRDWWHDRNIKALEGQKLTDLYIELNPDGTKNYLQVSFNPVREEGQINGVAHFMSDVTRSKQLEEDLQQKIIELENLNKKIME